MISDWTVGLQHRMHGSWGGGAPRFQLVDGGVIFYLNIFLR